MGFGGPVWHASARAINEATAWGLARRALQDVGDDRLGEWRERGERGTMHIRRRLSVAEQRDLGVRDIRGTAEERERLRRLVREVPGLRGFVYVPRGSD